MDKIEFAQKLAENVDAFNILYEDISDDGEGILRLTGLGEELADFIDSEISKAKKETLEKVLDYSKSFDYEFDACRETEKYLESELSKLTTK